MSHQFNIFLILWLFAIFGFAQRDKDRPDKKSLREETLTMAKSAQAPAACGEPMQSIIQLANLYESDSLPLRQETLIVVKSAQAIAARGEWEQAIEQIDEAINGLGDGDQFANYRSFLYFNRGYLYEQQPNSGSLYMAQASYKLALKYKPTSIKILNNLIIISKHVGNNEAALEYIEQIIHLDPASASKWYLVEGDIYAESKKYESAWRSYKKALAMNPNDRSAALKLISVYYKLPIRSDRRFLDQCVAFQNNGMSEIALQGLEEVIRHNCSVRSKTYEESLLMWCGINVERGWIDPRLLSNIDNMGCEIPPIADLESNLKAKWKTRPFSSWWYGNTHRKFFYLAMQKSWADYLLSIGKKEEAIELYEDTRKELRLVSDFSKEIFGREDVIETETIIQLAKLYASDTLARNKHKFNQLEDELFDLKGQEYRSKDLAGIQKFHTILAMIYIERGEWDGTFARNATFQLERAIRTADERVQRSPDVYRPIPHLYKNLAIAYQKSAHFEESANALLDAAIGYLETDHLYLAKEMLTSFDSLLSRMTSSEMPTKKNNISMIYQARSNIVDLSQEQLTEMHSTGFRKSPTYQWLPNTTKLDGFSQEQLERQRFKVFADLSDHAEEVGAADLAQALINEAIISAGSIRVLCSPQDVLRIKQMSNFGTLTANVHIENRKDPDGLLLPNQSDQKIRRVINIKGE